MTHVLRSLFVSALTLLPNTAFASDWFRRFFGHGHRRWAHPSSDAMAAATSVPELDSSFMGMGIALLFGTLLVLRSSHDRRAKGAAPTIEG